MGFERGLEKVNAAVSAKTGKPLSLVEVAILRGAWAGQTYEEIADAANYSVGYLKRHVGPKLWQLLAEVMGQEVSKANFRLALERWQRESSSSLSPPESAVKVLELPALAPPPSSFPPQYDWGEAVDVSAFYGRQMELAELRRWIDHDRCRLIAILGMGGVGKTALSVKLAQQLVQRADALGSSQDSEFQFMIWRSLRNAPPPEVLLTELVPFLSSHQETKPELGKLVQCFRQSRCLVILDNLETILNAEKVGRFRAGYEGYGELFRLVAEISHQSCLVVTSREKPSDVAVMEGLESAVRSLRLEGSLEAVNAIVQDKGLVGTDEQKRQLGDRYGNSPLALKIVATSIQELFDGSIESFLAEEMLIFNGIRHLLDQQFNRLSPLEKSIMYWLAVNRKWTTLGELQTDIVPPVPKTRLLEALESLSFRSLIEKQVNRYTQQPVVMEYVLERFTEQTVQELQTTELSLFLNHAILKATAEEYVRESQQRLIVKVIADQLNKQFGSAAALEQQTLRILTKLRRSAGQSAGYGAGNLLNLMRQLNLDLTGYNFSQLSIWQAYLQGFPLHQVNFTDADLTRSVFAETLSNVLAVAVSPDSSLLAIVDSNGIIGIWQVATGQRLLSIAAHEVWTLGLEFSPDQKTLVSGSYDRTIKFWDVQTGKCLQVWQIDDLVWDVQFSPDGQTLASSHEDGSIRLWHIASGHCLRHLAGHSAQAGGMAFHPHKPLLVSSGFDCTVKVWNLTTGDCLQTLKGHRGAVWTVAVNPQGTLLASASFDYTVKLWDIATGEWLHTLSLHTGRLQAIKFSPDGRTLASAGADSIIRLWNAQTGQCLSVLQGHTDTIWSIAFSADGQTLISGSDDHTVRFWSLVDGQCVRVLYGEGCGFRSVTVHPGGTGFATGSDDYRVRLWDFATGECGSTLEGHRGHIWNVVYHPQGRLLASCSLNGEVKLWDGETGRCRYTLQPSTHFINGITFHPQGHLLASGCNENCFKIWDVPTGECVRTIAIEDGSILTGLVFHPQGHLLASGHYNSLIRLWDPDSGDCRQVLRGHTNRVWTVSFHPQGHLLASGGEDAVVRLWDLASGDCQQALKGHTGTVFWVVFNPAGTVLASCSSDRTIRLWDVATGDCLQILEGHTKMVLSASFHPSQPSLLISGSQDETLRIWNIESGECLRILTPDRLYEGLNITGATGLTEGQKATLKQLGAIEG